VFLKKDIVPRAAVGVACALLGLLLLGLGQDPWASKKMLSKVRKGLLHLHRRTAKNAAQVCRLSLLARRIATNVARAIELQKRHTPWRRNHYGHSDGPHPCAQLTARSLCLKISMQECRG